MCTEEQDRKGSTCCQDGASLHEKPPPFGRSTDSAVLKARVGGTPQLHLQVVAATAGR